MPSSAWGIPATPDELEADRIEAQNAYRRRRLGEIREIQIRQRYRKFRVQEIEDAPTEVTEDGVMILGEPWFMAWLTVSTYLALAGRFEEIVSPDTWLSKRVLSGDVALAAPTGDKQE